MTHSEKVCAAIKTLKADAQYTFDGEINSEADFNKVRWLTSVDNTNPDFPTAVTSTTCPNAEITWSLFKAEYDKL